MYNFLSISSYRHISGTGLCEILFQTLHNGYTDMTNLEVTNLEVQRGQMGLLARKGAPYTMYMGIKKILELI